MQIREIQQQFYASISREFVMENCEMSAYTSFRAGGRTALLVLPQNLEQLIFVLRTLSEGELPYMVMGNGSNILVKDGGYPGVVVKLGEAFAGIEGQDETLVAGAGALMSSVAREAARRGLAGFEFASGIPGSIGGAVFMNAGAYGGEMKDIVKTVDAVSKDGKRAYSLCGEELDFSYRQSAFHRSGDVIFRVCLSLSQGDAAGVNAKMAELAERRNSKQPVHLPSAGSFFKRPAGHFAGKLIQDAGLSGLAVGGARVSPLHAGFIVNEGGATASDILALMRLVQNTVNDRYGVMLEPEVRIVGEE